MYFNTLKSKDFKIIDSLYFYPYFFKLFSTSSEQIKIQNFFNDLIPSIKSKSNFISFRLYKKKFRLINNKNSLVINLSIYSFTNIFNKVNYLLASPLWKVSSKLPISLKLMLKTEALFNYQILPLTLRINLKLQYRLRLKAVLFNLVEKYLISFLNSKTNQKIGIKFLKYSLRRPSFKVFYYNISGRVRFLPMLRLLKLKYKNIVRIMYAFLCFKDLEIIKSWTERSMSKLPFRLHRRFLYFFKVLMLKIVSRSFENFHIIGFNLTVHGKIGLGGNSKTKTYIIKAGSYCRTYKQLKLLNTKGSVKTLSGLLSLDFFLTF